MHMKPPTATSAMATAAMSGLFDRFFFMGAGARLGSDESSGVDSTLTVDSFSVRGEPQDGQNEEPSGAFFPHLGQNILPPFKLGKGPGAWAGPSESEKRPYSWFLRRKCAPAPIAAMPASTTPAIMAPAASPVCGRSSPDCAASAVALGAGTL